jgi:hypothetical protein
LRGWRIWARAKAKLIIKNPSPGTVMGMEVPGMTEYELLSTAEQLIKPESLQTSGTWA